METKRAVEHDKPYGKISLPAIKQQRSLSTIQSRDEVSQDQINFEIVRGNQYASSGKLIQTIDA